MILPGPRVTVVLCKPIRPNSLQDMAGIEWAPLKLPIKRRLQTLAVMIHVYTFLFGHIFGVLLLLVLLLFPYTTIFALLYLGWAYVLNAQTPSRGGRIIPRLRRWKLWKYFCDFFPIHLVKTAELDPKKNYIIGYHPHGIMGFGALGNFNSEATGFSEKFPGIVPHLLTLAGNFRLPFMRDYIMAFGNCSVEKGSIEHIVQKMGPGHSAIIVLGGAAESLDAHPGSFKLTIKNRKGFVKIALRTGASLVPVFSFGENDVYEQVKNPRGSPLRQWQVKMKDLVGFAPPLFRGRGVFQYTFGFLPYRRPIYTVVGEPIDIKQVDNPSIEEIDAKHTEYLDALNALFEKQKLTYGISEDTHLEFC